MRRTTRCCVSLESLLSGFHVCLITQLPVPTPSSAAHPSPLPVGRAGCEQEKVVWIPDRHEKTVNTFSLFNIFGTVRSGFDVRRISVAKWLPMRSLRAEYAPLGERRCIRPTDRVRTENGVRGHEGH